VEKIAQRGALCSVLLNKNNSGDQIKLNDMGRACGMKERQMSSIPGPGG
jgi:hypothetical protein